jgi:hypothetical protein
LALDPEALVRGTRTERRIRFDKDGHTSLDGETVWAALAEADKVFDRVEFDSQALQHNLRDTDCGRPLSEIRDSFFDTPRLPLLPGGEDDLRSALYGAVKNADLRPVDKDGNDRAVKSSSEINLSSSGLRLARPAGAGDAGSEVEMPDLVGRPADQAIALIEAAGLTIAGEKPTGTITAPSTAAGAFALSGFEVTLTATESDGTGVQAVYQVSVTLNTSLSDDGRRHAVRKLLSTLATDADASHVQMTVKFTAPAASKDHIIEQAQAAGAQQAGAIEL